LALRLLELTRHTVPPPQHIVRVLMRSMTGTEQCGPDEVFRADVPGVPFQTGVGRSPRREP